MDEQSMPNFREAFGRRNQKFPEEDGGNLAQIRQDEENNRKKTPVWKRFHTFAARNFRFRPREN